MHRLTGLALAGLAAAATTWAPAPAAHAADGFTRECKVIEVSAFDNRVHVRCEAIVSDPWDPDFFAVEADSPMADRLVAIGTTAMIEHRTLLIYYMLGAQGPPGCLMKDCRRPVSFTLR